ncbi:T-cell surface glycoprotein CD1a-like isoform X1 [Equus przewalskii]|uniref:CD1 protein n=3 Tax=Equus TaxID=9789 RepID=G3FP00_HORSE|nr:CD1a2 molecule precursor [Equus caballus]XP_008533586.1 PREDICTED: T-cell surface glycoprotein CD1a-like [Equus przewalskii]AEO72065.1 CD1 protein [Equus caballus]
MLFLQFLLLAVLLPGGDNKDDFQEPISFQIIQISSFYNRSWVQTLGSGWLGELQVHGWKTNPGGIIFLWPWSKGNFSNEEMMELENFFRGTVTGIHWAFHNLASEWQLAYPFEVQMVGGCEMHFGRGSVGFLRIAYQGSDFLIFQNNSWWPSPTGGSRAQHASTLFNGDIVILESIDRLLSDTCPRFLLGLLDAGKAYLGRQVKPEAWLSSGPSPHPGHLMLLCHVSGFYPKPIWVMWMLGDQEHPGTQQRDILPNADGTWYLRKSLDVKAIETAGLSCRVRHSSLGGQDMILYWEHHISTGLIFLAVIVALVLLTGLAFWLRKRWIRHQLQRTLLPLD